MARRNHRSHTLLMFRIVFLSVSITLPSLSQSRLGRYNENIPRYLIIMIPTGLDMAWRLVTRLQSNTFVEYICNDVLCTPGRTVEMNLLGNDIFITDRAENIKAIQADQFVDFAKGQTPHDVFSSILGDSIFTSKSQLDLMHCKH